MAFQFKIQLDDIEDPQVWRRLLVPEQFTFNRFHKLIQAAFGWGDYHLYQFSPKGWASQPIIGVPFTESEYKINDSKKIKLFQIFNSPKQKFTYIYDFGDNWSHNIILEKITDEKILRADCLAGNGACPPEDCGSVPGYENLKAILNNPKDPEYAEMKEWLGLKKNQKWDANSFDLEKTKHLARKV